MSCIEYFGRYEAQLAPYAAAAKTTMAASEPITRKRLRRVRSLSGDGDERLGVSLNESVRICAPGFRRRRSMIGRDDIFAHVSPEHFRNDYRAVGALVVLYDLAEDARCRKCSVVQSVYIAQHSVLAAVANIESASLEIMEVRRRMRLSIFFFARHPGLALVLFHLPQPQIAAAIDDDMVRKCECLQEFLRIFCEFLMPFYRFFVIRFAQDDLLVFQEFVYTKDAFRILAVAPRFAPKARREREKSFRKTFFVENFVHVVSHCRDFGGTSEVIAVLRFVEIFLALWKISGTDERLTPHYRGHDHRCEPEFYEAVFDESVQRPHEPRTVILEKVAPETCDLRAAFVISHVMHEEKFGVALRLKIKFRCFSPRTHLFIVRVRLAFRNRNVGNIRHLHHQRSPLFQYFLHRLFFKTKCFFDFLHFRNDGLSLCIPLGRRDSVRSNVLLRTSLVYFRLQFAAFVVEREQFVEIDIDALLFCTEDDYILIFPDKLNIEHDRIITL